MRTAHKGWLSLGPCKEREGVPQWEGVRRRRAHLGEREGARDLERAHRRQLGLYDSRLQPRVQAQRLDRVGGGAARLRRDPRPYVRLERAVPPLDGAHAQLDPVDRLLQPVRREEARLAVGRRGLRDDGLVRLDVEQLDRDVRLQQDALERHRQLDVQLWHRAASARQRVAQNGAELRGIARRSARRGMARAW